MNPVDHAIRAQQHRPTDPAALAAEIKRLAASGLKARDIAGALRLDMAAVLEALYGHPGGQQP